MLPALSAIYGLRLADCLSMPYDELTAYLAQLEHWVSVVSAGAYEPKGRRGSSTGL